MNLFKNILLFILLLLELLCTPESPNNRKITSEILKKSSQSWDGSLLPNYPQGQPEITIARIIIPPETKIPLHKHPVINAGYVIKGELTVISEDNKVLHLKSGDSAIEMVNKWHYAENKSGKDVELVVFYAGTPGDKLSIKK